MSRGKKNVYKCAHCGAETVTVDLDEGVTPFMIDCDKCGEMMTSSFYNVDQDLEPTHEWYMPGAEERIRLAASLAGFALLKSHVNRGGLILREMASALEGACDGRR